MVDFSISVYASIKSPVLQGNTNRLVGKGFLEKPGTGKLFKAVNSDFTYKWRNKTPPMKLLFVGDTLRKATMEFPLGGYKKDF